MPVPIKVRNNTNTVKVDVKKTNSGVPVKDKSNLTIQSINVKDNSKDFKVKVNDESRDVLLDCGCDINAKKLDLEIKDEARTREAADKKLEKQIQDVIVSGVNVDNDTIVLNKNNEISVNPELLNNIDDKIKEVDNKVKKKQDEIKFINVDSTSGILDASSLNLLKNSNVHRLVYNNIIYYMSLRDRNVKKYFSRVASSTLNELDLDINTGEYNIKSTLDPIIEEHINNKVIHVTKEDRRRWDNKVTASVTEIEEDDYRLNLTKD